MQKNHEAFYPHVRQPSQHVGRTYPPSPGPFPYQKRHAVRALCLPTPTSVVPHIPCMTVLPCLLPYGGGGENFSRAYLSYEPLGEFYTVCVCHTHGNWEKEKKRRKQEESDRRAEEEGGRQGQGRHGAVGQDIETGQTWHGITLALQGKWEGSLSLWAWHGVACPLPSQFPFPLFPANRHSSLSLYLCF